MVVDTSHKINEKLTQSLNLLKGMKETVPEETHIINALFPQNESTLGLHLDQSSISKGKNVGKTSLVSVNDLSLKGMIGNVTTFHQLYQKVNDDDKRLK